MAKRQIKIIEAGYSKVLEEQVNDFLAALETEPVKITYGNSFGYEYDDTFVLYQPTYTAIVEYPETQGNVYGVVAYNETH